MRWQLAVFWIFIGGCAIAPKIQETDPKTLLSQACAPGSEIQEVKGSIWLKAKSKDASGQFPAVVDVSSSGKLKMEVTNLLGGTEAVITVQDKSFSIRSQNKNVQNQKGYGAWAGIPLEWATELFLGRIPCPSPRSLTGARVRVSPEDELIVETTNEVEKGPERYIYRFRNWGGRLWAESLHWERKGALSAAVDFSFDDPEDKTGSPKKWEAKSPQGEVKVRWKEKESRAQ